MGSVASSPSGGGDGASNPLLIPAAVAVGIYIVLHVVDGMIALPLRESSSRISAALLNALTIPVTRNGTMLSTENFDFDVVPACSGSTTLRVLVGVGVIWCGIHPRLSPLRKLLCSALAVPVALLANGLRVAALVGLGDLAGRPVEGIPHILVGLLTFSLGMAAVFLVTEVLASRERVEVCSEGTRWGILALALAFLYIPVWIWFYENWSLAPIHAFGALYVAVGSAAFAAAWICAPTRGPGGGSRAEVEGGGEGGPPAVTPRHGPRRARGAIPTFAGAMLVLVAANLIDTRALQAASLLLALAALLAAFHGWAAAARGLPALVVAGLGFPLVDSTLNQISKALFGFISTPLTQGFKAALATGLLVLLWWLLHRAIEASEDGDEGKPAAAGEAGPGPTSTRVWVAGKLNALLLLTALGFLFQTLFNSQAAAFDRQFRLEMSYLQGDWIGQNAAISDAAIDLIGRQRIYSRRYTRGGQSVDVIVTATGADRRRAHPPEACMTGAGWKVVRQALTRTMVGGREIPASQFLFRRNGRDLDFYYWFTDGKVHLATYGELFRTDLARRLGGERTDWFLFRVLAHRENSALDEFLRTLRAEIVEVPADGAEAGE